MSVAPSTSSFKPRHCSGDMYAGVPKMTPVRVFAPSLPAQSGRNFAIPKSSTFTRSPPGTSGPHQEQILGLEIAMNDLDRVRRRHRARRLDRDVDGLADAHPLAREPPRQRLAVQELHHDVRDFVLDHPDVDHLDDVRVMDGGGRARLIDEPQHQAGTLEVLALQHLHCDAAPQYRMLRQVHDAHRPVADQLAELVVVDFLPDHFPGTRPTRF